MINHDFDNWIDELDISHFENTGKAILHRKYVKDGNFITTYLSNPEKAPIVAKGITAFLYSNSYSGGLQPLPINMAKDKTNIDIYKYFEKYYSISKLYFLKQEKSKPNSVHLNLDKSFLKTHIK